MIAAQNPYGTEEEFVTLLENSKIELLSCADTITPAYSALDFEQLVCEKMQKSSKGTSFEGTIIQTPAKAFPDIVANNFYGVEVKFTKDDKWQSVGNSINESSRVKTISRIYMAFGKAGGGFDFRYRLYQECLSGVSMTHYPRYQIDMNLPVGSSVFDAMGTSYDSLRLKAGGALEEIRKYYGKAARKSGGSLWWTKNDDGIVSDGLFVKPWGSISTEEKNNHFLEVLILFPEVFDGKYETAAGYLITEFNVYSHSMRDHFSAGGREDIRIGDKEYQVSQVISKIFKEAVNIQRRLKEIDIEKMKYYWNLNSIEDREAAWLILLDKYCTKSSLGIKPSDVYQAGLVYHRYN